MNSKMMENNIMLEQIYEVLDETGDEDERRDLLKKVTMVNPLDVNSRTEWIKYQPEEEQNDLFLAMIDDVKKAVLEENPCCLSTAKADFLKVSRARLYLLSMLDYRTYLFDHGRIEEALQVTLSVKELDPENSFKFNV